MMIMKLTLTVSLLCLLVAQVSDVFAQNANQQNARPNFSAEWRELYEAREYQGVPYRLMKPIDLTENPKQKYPLILSLHGAGARGTDNRKNLRIWNEVMAREELRRRHPAFVVVPQSEIPWIVPGSTPEITGEMIANSEPLFQPRLKLWGSRQDLLNQGMLKKVFDLLDALAQEFNIDADRVYVLGHSMGGAGTWTSIYEQPDRFAAAIPTAGGLMPWMDLNNIAHIPIWSFHGDIDPTVSVEFTRYAFNNLTELKGNMKYTELKDVKHNAANYGFVYTGDDPEKGFITHYSSDKCDKTADVWDWLFAQKRK
jgi:predicted peptidase